jgi:hypothetical protein
MNQTDESPVFGASEGLTLDLDAARANIDAKTRRAPRNPRTERGRAAIMASNRRDAKRLLAEDAIDALADILHYAHSRGWPAPDLARIALGHFTTETKDRP